MIKRIPLGYGEFTNVNLDDATLTYKCRCGKTITLWDMMHYKTKSCEECDRLDVLFIKIQTLLEKL